MDKNKKVLKNLVLNQLDRFYDAESRGFIVRPDGSQIICHLASPGEVTWHQIQKQMLMERQVMTTATNKKIVIDIPKKSTVEAGNEKTAEAMRRARGGAM